jgi:hypothetical protein
MSHESLEAGSAEEDGLGRTGPSSQTVASRASLLNFASRAVTVENGLPGTDAVSKIVILAFRSASALLDSSTFQGLRDEQPCTPVLF